MSLWMDSAGPLSVGRLPDRSSRSGNGAKSEAFLVDLGTKRGCLVSKIDEI